MEANTAKAISMLALGLGSFITGMFPACISEGARQRHPLVLSCFLCFGAGVLLFTSLIHMLPEAREQLPKYSELVFCGGFFLVYLVDEFVHFFYGTGHDTHQAQPASRQSYGSNEQSRLLGHLDNLDNREMLPRDRCCGDTDNPRMCHVSHTPPCNKSSSGLIGLLCALLVHSVFEGLAIGLQQDATQVLILFGAVASHKYVVGFCLGTELVASGLQACGHIVSVALFSGGSVAGIVLGGALDSVETIQKSVAMPIMQALAGGTLLYVTVSEVLPRERARWHERRRGAGLVQLFALTAGFAIMYVTTKYADPDAN